MASANFKEEQDLYVKEGSKLYSKMLSKEAAAALAVPSFRVYYGVASAGFVPFLWESQPGTPKSLPSEAAVRPLTPPPSYYTGGGKSPRKATSTKRWPGAGAILPRMITLLRRPGRRTSPCSLSWSSSPTASSMSPVFTVQSSTAVGSSGAHRRTFSAGDEEEAAARCFGMERECERGMMKGCGVAVAVRNALATVVGHKSGRRATSAAA